MRPGPQALLADETVTEGRMTEMHIGLKGTMNALLPKDLAQRTHRGLEGRVREGRSAGGKAHGHPAVGRAPNGSPPREDLATDTAEAAVVCRVFRDCAAGLSPRRIASDLDHEGLPGPRGKLWGADDLRQAERGTGLLNNELYPGRRVWNRQRSVTDPQAGKRQARPNAEDDPVVQEVQALRVVTSDLWGVKAR